MYFGMSASGSGSGSTFLPLLAFSAARSSPRVGRRISTLGCGRLGPLAFACFELVAFGLSSSEIFRLLYFPVRSSGWPLLLLESDEMVMGFLGLIGTAAPGLGLFRETGIRSLPIAAVSM